MTTRSRLTAGLVLSASALVLLLACADEPSLVTEGFVEVEEGIELYYRRVGDGPEAVVIPGGMYLEEEFKRLAAADRTLLFYDMRGRGKSTTITDAAKLGIEYELADLDTLRRHFGFEYVSLIGSSYLGGVVVRYALRYPEQVERIVQIGPIPPRRQPHMDAYQAAIAVRRGSADLAQLDSLMQAIGRGEDPVRNRQAYWRILHKAMKYDPDVDLRFRSDYYTLENERPDNVWDFHLPAVVGSLGDWDWRPELSRVAIPVLTIHGDYDALPLDGAREWVASLPDAQLLIVPQAGHFPWAEKPEIVFPAINGFLMGKWPE
jgi:proline iminopeptidase